MTALTICSPQRWAGSTYTRWWHTPWRCTGWPGPASWSRTRSRFCKPKKMWRWSTWRTRTEHVSPAAKIPSPHTNPSADLHFNENGPERKYSSEADDDSRLHEPERLQDSTYEYDWTQSSVHIWSPLQGKDTWLIVLWKGKRKRWIQVGNSSLNVAWNHI